MWIINLVLCWALWKASDQFFDIGAKAIAWFMVAASAANGAVVMTHIL
jgi:hypothetical protein